MLLLFFAQRTGYVVLLYVQLYVALGQRFFCGLYREELTQYLAQPTLHVWVGGPVNVEGQLGAH